MPIFEKKVTCSLNFFTGLACRFSHVEAGIECSCSLVKIVTGDCCQNLVKTRNTQYKLINILKQFQKQLFLRNLYLVFVYARDVFRSLSDIYGETFGKNSKRIKPLTIFAKSFTIDARQGFKCASRYN